NQEREKKKKLVPATFVFAIAAITRKERERGRIKEREMMAEVLLPPSRRAAAVVGENSAAVAVAD
ncbi:hypothetical protein PIB30_056023, partial [Stylosanthes scabra]|nr:hypothetical protein [Stylosanthes scabra]